MTADNGTDPMTLLQRIDLALAERLAAVDSVDSAHPERVPSTASDPEPDAVWVARILALRGFVISVDECADILAGQRTRFRMLSQEIHLVRGLRRVREAIAERAARGRAPDGWFAVEMFRLLTERIARFRGNAIRRDAPWDALVPLAYPAPAELPDRIERFCAEQGYGTDPAAFAAQHPVRQAVLAFWGFARLAPFPDFNLMFAHLVMNAYLRAKGYPALLPERGDRALLARIAIGPAPKRVVQFESRLLESVGR